MLELNDSETLCRYIGEYEPNYNAKHGFAVYEWWEDNKNGKYTMKEWHKGWFVLGQMRGYGQRNYKENQVVYRGNWEDNEKHGEGELEYPEKGEKYIYS